MKYYDGSSDYYSGPSKTTQTLLYLATLLLGYTLGVFITNRIVEDKAAKYTEALAQQLRECEAVIDSQ